MIPKSLYDIYKEALSDSLSVELKRPGYDIRMLHGVEIRRYVKDGNIEILNPRGKDYDEALTVKEYELFKDGWRKGVYKIVLQVYIEKLNSIKERIPQLISQKKSIKRDKTNKNNIIKKYNRITKKLNQLK